MVGSRPPSEFEIIARYFAPLAEGFPGALGLRDDAALLDPGQGKHLVAATDALVAGIHFRPDDPADTVGRKLLRVNLSDLAAMGARPIAYQIAAVLPRDLDIAWLEGFVAGLAEDQARFGVFLCGGDTVAGNGPTTLALTVFGEVARGHELRRAAAREGDLVYVSGTLGDGLLGLMALDGKAEFLAPDQRAGAVARYRLPEPRLALGQGLVGLAHAAIDVSDGLIADLGHVCAASGLGAVVEVARLPLSAAGGAANRVDPGFLTRTATGGDDYELLFTVPEDCREAVAALAGRLDLPLVEIGRMTAVGGVRLFDETGTELATPRTGYRHY
ncbi:MAG: thiamine-phosphate kinase [Alphaproteobacteria bacterium]